MKKLKEHLQKLLILNFVSNKKVKFKDYLNISNSIEKISIPLFPFDGKYLKKRGMKEGAIMGKTLVMLQNEWVNNGFKISDQRISKIIIDQK